MAEPSGLFKAGTILLLVGAIMQTVGAVLVIAMSVLAGFLDRTLSGGDTNELMVVTAIYFAIGVFLGAGALFAFLAYGKAKSGNAYGAWVQGLVASLLPPLQVISLLGAIFCLVSPEGEATKRARGM